jgi:replicative DNA helicase
MITEPFINMCCECSLSDSKEITPDVIASIYGILKYHQINDENNMPPDLKGKFELACTIVKLREEGNTAITVYDNIMSMPKHEEFRGFLQYCASQDHSNEDSLKDYIGHIKVKKRFSKIAKEFSKLQTFVDDFESNAFDDLNQVVNEYDDLISGLYIDLAEEKRQDNISRVASLDCVNDNFDDVLNQLESNNSGENTVPTGYLELDALMKKGYNPSRLYVIGGSSGDGKSTFLINNIHKAVEHDSHDNSGLSNIYAYATLENLLDESLHRLYCSWSDKDPDKVVKFLNDGERDEIRNFIKGKCNKYNANIIMEYFAPDSLTVFGLRHWIQTIKDQHKGKGRLRAVYVDYLDLLKSGKNYDVYRLELGQITLLLKAVAVIENIPIITVTQLNREGYDKEVFSLTQMSESIKKVEHADFVALLKNQDEEEAVGGYHKLELFIGKNRSGPKNKKVILRSKFSNFQIKDNLKGGGMSFDEGAKRAAGTHSKDLPIMEGFL